MYLKSIEISNFRNIKKLNLDLNKKNNIFIGNNAQGKTSILESIYVLAFTKSFKTVYEEEIINKDSDFFRVKGNYKVGNISRKLEVYFDKNEKKVKINNKKVNKISDYISNLNVIMFSPDDLDIVKKAPSFRRNFLNIELCQLYSEYLKNLNEYNKLLKMRNEYIRKNFNNIDYNYLDIITSNLVDRIIVITEYRKNFLEEVNKNIDDVFYKITKKRGIQINYKKSINVTTKEEIFNFYKENYVLDIDKGSTMYGSHRDDFIFYFNKNDLKIYGSQGLQRLAILAFKFSEIEIFKKIRGSYPIVLLDDIFSEIDLPKRKNILRFIKGNIQYIITTTDVNNISDKMLDKSSIFKIEDGMIKKRRDNNE